MNARTALVIEDNENNMELITFILETHGYRTLRAVTGQQGIDMALTQAPDFVLLDIQLPDMDGSEALREIRARESERQGPARLPVIAVRRSRPSRRCAGIRRVTVAPRASEPSPLAARGDAAFAGGC